MVDFASKKSIQTLLVASCIIFLASSPVKPNNSKLPKISELYPNGIKFDVFRNNEKVGGHAVRFSYLISGSIGVYSKLIIKVRFLGLLVYKYDYESQSIWSNGRLIQLEANQDENGQVDRVNVEKKNSRLVVTSAQQNNHCALTCLPSNHWNASILDKNQVINTLTGEISNIEIENLGKFTIIAQGKEISAYKYRYTGDINALVWYTENGRWVKLQFSGKDGSIIDYECIECGLRFGGEASD